MEPNTARCARRLTLLACVLAAVPALAQTPLGTAFTYQGRLMDGGVPANGAYDFRFILMDAEAGGSQVGPIALRDDVAVTSGLFTLSLDFGGVFTGSKRFLEVAARPGTSTGPYTSIGGRQELAPTPNAVFSAATGDVTVQRRTVTPTCPSGQYLRSLAADGTPTCAPDLDTNSGGTVQSVATGAGLTGGPFTLTGTVAVATGGITSSLLADSAVTSAKIASGAVGSAQIDQTQVQVRITGTCGVGEYFRGVNADGTVVCEPVPGVPAITAVDDPANNVGAYTSIAIGNDGLPVISYLDNSAVALKVAKCVNAACTGASTTTVDDPANNVGVATSIAIGADGLPVISYQDSTANTLKVAKCLNAACTGASTITTVDDPANNVGSWTSIAIGADGLPVISYGDNTASTLKVAKCANAACTGASTITTVDDPANNVGWYTSIAIGTDTFPVISYYDSTAQGLKVAKCVNATCTGVSTITTVDDPANSVGSYTSIAIGVDGLPVISYYDSTAQALKVAKCGNTACTSGNTITTVDDPANGVGQYTSIAIGADGLPVMSYYDSSVNTLKVAKCANTACTGVSTITTVDDPANNVGSYTSIAIGADGLPVISYKDNTAGTLKVAKCGTRSCQ